MLSLDPGKKSGKNKFFEDLRRIPENLIFYSFLNWKWCGGVLVDEKIFCVPQSVASVLVIDLRSQHTFCVA